MTRLDTLIFDLDGTLWDATAASAIGWTRAARAHGIDLEITADDIGRVCGFPFEACAEMIFPDLSRDRLEALMPHLSRGEEDAVREFGGRLYTGVAEGLHGLAEHVPLDLLSNCHRWYLEIFLEQAGCEGVFRDALCHGDTGFDKARNLALLSTRHRSASPAYVGDTPGDAEACREAGFEFVYAAYGFGEVPTPGFESFGALCGHLLARVR